MRFTKASVIFIFLLAAHIVDVRAQSDKKQQPGVPVPPAPRGAAQQVEDVSTQIDKSRVKKQAQELADAFVAGNFEKVADLTHPVLVELSGGKAKMVAGLKQEMSEPGAESFRVLSMPVGEPKRVVKSQDYLLAVVPVTMRVKMPEGVYAQRIAYLGVSQDGGQNWTFLSGGIDKGTLKVLFPLIPTAIDELELPAGAPLVRESNR